MKECGETEVPGCEDFIWPHLAGDHGRWDTPQTGAPQMS